MKKVFGSDSLLFRIMTILMEFAAMNLLFILCSVPLVTAGAAYTALMDSLYLFLQKGEGIFGAGHFLKIFRENLKQTIAMWCGSLVSMILLVYGIWYWLTSLTGVFCLVMAGVYVIIFVLVFGVLQFWLFLLARGQKPCADFLKDCFLLSLAKFPCVLVMAVVSLSPLMFLQLPVGVMIRVFPVYMLYCFSFPAYFCAWIHARVLPPLYPGLDWEEENNDR